MSISQNFPNTRPSLSINFARSQTLDPRITFTRTTSGTRVGPDGYIEVIPADQPRFDFDPVTGECLGLLIEESRNNLITYSEKIGATPFETYGWSNQNSIAVQADTADVSDPSGGNTASKLTNGSTSPISQTLKGSSLSATVYTASVYLRTLSGTETASIIVFLQSSPYTTIGNSGELTITSEWQRFDITTSTATSANYNFGIQVRSGTIYAWGAQLEEGSFPTSYIPTTNTTVTRTADNANITGSNVESWYRQDEGTFISDSRILQSGVKTQGVWGIGDGTNQISLRSPQVTGDRFRGNIGNIFTVAPGTGDTLLNTFKAAISYTSTVGRLQVGTASNEVTPSQLPINPNTFGIGNLGGGSTPLTGIIKQIVYYPVKLDNNILQTLTK